MISKKDKDKTDTNKNIKIEFILFCLETTLEDEDKDN